MAGFGAARAARPIRAELRELGLLAQTTPDAANQPEEQVEQLGDEMRGAGEGGARVLEQARTPDAQRATLSQWVALLLCLAWLLWTRRADLTWVARRVSSWASAGTQPALTYLAMAYLAWASRGQARLLWTSVQALVRRNTLCVRPAT